MIVKLIDVDTLPGRADEFLRRQQEWTQAMLKQPGCQWVHVAADPENPNGLVVLIGWADRSFLDRFMDTVHDDLEKVTRISETYERIRVRLLEVI